MQVLIGIIITLSILVIAGTWLSNRFGKKGNDRTAEGSSINTDCCGAHDICEFQNMLNNPEEIVYFEDEELDRFREISPDNYQDDQIEEIREVLYTLDSEDIRKWLLSIERRKIQLPHIIKQEAVQLLAEATIQQN